MFIAIIMLYCNTYCIIFYYPPLFVFLFVAEYFVVVVVSLVAEHVMHARPPLAQKISCEYNASNCYINQYGVGLESPLATEQENIQSEIKYLGSDKQRFDDHDHHYSDNVRVEARQNHGSTPSSCSVRAQNTCAVRETEDTLQRKLAVMGGGDGPSSVSQQQLLLQQTFAQFYPADYSVEPAGSFADAQEGQSYGIRFSVRQQQIQSEPHMISLSPSLSSPTSSLRGEDDEPSAISFPSGIHPRENSFSLQEELKQQNQHHGSPQDALYLNRDVLRENAGKDDDVWDNGDDLLAARILESPPPTHPDDHRQKPQPLMTSTVRSAGSASYGVSSSSHSRTQPTCSTPRETKQASRVPLQCAPIKKVVVSSRYRGLTPMNRDTIYEENVTGAELLAVLRMRHVIASFGDTEEYKLPSTRCHRILLTQDEKDQLFLLRQQLANAHRKGAGKSSRQGGSNAVDHFTVKKQQQKNTTLRTSSPGRRAHIR